MSVTQVNTKILYTTSHRAQFGTTASVINQQSPWYAMIFATITPRRGNTAKNHDSTIPIL